MSFTCTSPSSLWMTNFWINNKYREQKYKLYHRPPSIVYPFLWIKINNNYIICAIYGDCWSLTHFFVKKIQTGYVTGAVFYWKKNDTAVMLHNRFVTHTKRGSSGFISPHCLTPYNVYLTIKFIIAWEGRMQWQIRGINIPFLAIRIIRVRIWYLFSIWNTGKKELLKKAQNNKIANVAGSVWLSLFVDGSVKCKLPSTLPSSGLRKNSAFKYRYCKFWILNNRRCVYTVVVKESSMRHRCHSLTSDVWHVP